MHPSYGSKRHAFEVARREADKRGFHRGSGKLVQIVTDGDEHFEDLVKEYFPEARHTLDAFHVVERLWEVGRAVFPEGSSELTSWVKAQESLLYRGKERAVIEKVLKLQRKAPRPGVYSQDHLIQSAGRPTSVSGGMHASLVRRMFG